MVTVRLSLLLVGFTNFQLADASHTQRVCKCCAVWQELYPWSYDEDLVEFFIGEHERVGLGPEWWYSLIYGASGAGLRADMHYGPARGMFDQHFTFIQCRRRQFDDVLPEHAPWGPTALHVPKVAVRAHVLEASYYHERTGRLGWALQRKVFLPARADGARALGEERRWRWFGERHLVVLTARWSEIDQAVPEAVASTPVHAPGDLCALACEVGGDLGLARNLGRSGPSQEKGMATSDHAP